MLCARGTRIPKTSANERTRPRSHFIPGNCGTTLWQSGIRIFFLTGDSFESLVNVGEGTSRDVHIGHHHPDGYRLRHGLEHFQPELRRTRVLV